MVSTGLVRISLNLKTGLGQIIIWSIWTPEQRTHWAPTTHCLPGVSIEAWKWKCHGWVCRTSLSAGNQREGEENVKPSVKIKSEPELGPVTGR